MTTNSEPGDIYNETPAWSPTGQQIAFRTRFTIALFNLQNQSLTYPIGKEWYMYDPAWAPDGRRLVAFGYLPKQQTGDGLYLIELNNGNLTRLTVGDDHSPDWSPDNRHIVFLHSDESGLPKSLRIIDADGSNPHDILPAVGGRSSPKWSPDSTRIAFVEHEDIGGQIGAAGIYTIAADGSDLTTVVAPGRQTWGRELSGLIPLPRTVRYTDLAWCLLRY